MKSILIFDFDGTIADSLKVLIDEFHMWSKRETPLTSADIERLRNMHAREVLKELGISLWHLPALLTTGRAKMTSRIGEIKPFEGINEALKRLHEKHVLYVMSSNSKVNVDKFLKEHNLVHYFHKTYGGVGIFSKAHILRRIVRDNHLQAADCFYIGDEARDIEAAKRIGMRSVAVAWGYNGLQILHEHQPDFIVMQPAELSRMLLGK